MFELNKIYLGDAYELIKKIPDKSIDLIVTDPPYQIEQLSGGGMAKEKHINNVMEQIGEAKIDVGIDLSLLPEFMRVMKKPNIYIWCNEKQVYEYLKFFVGENKCNLKIITWHKTNAMPLCGGKYLNDTEFCLYFFKGVRLNTTYASALTHYEQPINKADKEQYDHPTIKPLNIIKNLIINSSNGGGYNSRSVYRKRNYCCCL